MNARTGPKLLAALVALAVIAAGFWYARGGEGVDRLDARAPEIPRESESLPAPAALEAATERAAVRPGAAETSEAPPAHALAPAVAASAAEAAPALAEARLLARFVDVHGQPWAGVRFRDGVDALHATVSAPDGRAELAFPGRSGGEWVAQVVASREGCASRTIRVTLASGRTVDLGELVLEPGSRLAGFVRDERGKPVPLAMVGLSPLEYAESKEVPMRRQGSSSFEHAGAVTSDAQGAFTLEGVSVGTWRLWGHAEELGYGVTEPLEVRAGQDLAGIQLELPDLLATDTITGKVVDPQGQPVPSAVLRTFARLESHSASMTSNADAKGEFAIRVYLEATTMLIASDPEQRWSDAALSGVQPGARDLVLQLSEPRFVKVRVVGPADEPVRGASFTSLAGDEGNVQWMELSVKELEAGSYELRVPGVPFTLQAKAERYLEGSLPRMQPDAVPAELVLRLEAAPILRGRVVAGGNGVAGATVEAHQAVEGNLTLNDFPCRMHPSSSASATSGPDGSFELTLASTGAVYLRATAPGWAAGLAGPVRRDTAAAPIEIEITRGGLLEGRARAKDGSTLPGAIVGVTNGDGHPRTMRAGLDGTFRFEDLTPGPWLVTVRQDEFRTDSTTMSSSDQDVPIAWSCEVAAGRTTFQDALAP